MSAAVACEELPAAVFEQAHIAMQRALRLFRRSPSCVMHTLRVASSDCLIERWRGGRRTRMVPSVWGVRRDEYRWRGDVHAAFSLLLKGASIMGRALVHAPLPGWMPLLPGSMQQIMGCCSDLYLADYWLLTLHHLAWSGRLPYPLRMQWFCGESIQDARFGFASQLPAHLAEASLDALILFRETATKLTHVAQAMPPVEPPALNRVPPTPGGAAAAAKESAAPPDEPGALATGSPEPGAQAQGPVLPELNDQTFTVRSGGRSYRFTARNKQLFALLDRIRRRPGHRVSFDELRSVGDVWDGSQVEDSTITGAVTRLRKLLKAQEMVALANIISTGSYQGRRYVVLQTAAADTTAE